MLRNEVFAEATDWCPELAGGIHIRYTCPKCGIMPVLQNHFWLLAELRASEADDALVDTQTGRPA
eukprot:6990868-Lingulodinium_polyedra.AAC.1